MNKLTITIYFLDTDQTPEGLTAVAVTNAERWPLSPVEQRLATEQLEHLF